MLHFWQVNFVGLAESRLARLLMIHERLRVEYGVRPCHGLDFVIAKLWIFVLHEHGFDVQILDENNIVCEPG